MNLESLRESSLKSVEVSDEQLWRTSRSRIGPLDTQEVVVVIEGVSSTEESSVNQRPFESSLVHLEMNQNV